MINLISVMAVVGQLYTGGGHEYLEAEAYDFSRDPDYGPLACLDYTHINQADDENDRLLRELNEACDDAAKTIADRIHGETDVRPPLYGKIAFIPQVLPEVQNRPSVRFGMTRLIFKVMNGCRLIDMGGKWRK